jgi:hypothetical protein
VSERQLDEEFGKLKFLNIENLTQLNHAINSFGSIVTLTNKYATQRPPTSELNDLSPTIEQQQQTNSGTNGKNSNNNANNTNNNKLNGNHSNNIKLANGVADKNNNNKQPHFGQNGAANNTPKLNGNNNNKQTVETKTNGAYFSDFIDEVDNNEEGEFIEVKKPRMFLKN